MAEGKKASRMKSGRAFPALNFQNGDMVIDLGSKNTVIYSKNKGVVMNEKSCAAIDVSTGEVVAAGDEAFAMYNKTGENLSVEFPVKNGAVADVEVASAMLKYFIKKYVGTGFVAKPRVIMTVPSSTSEVERIAAETTAKNAGADIVDLIEYPLAAAMGTGSVISSGKGTMILSLGADITECAVICAGDVVTSAGIKSGSDRMDKEITRLVRRKYGINIGAQTAENIKKEIGSVYPDEKLSGSFVEARGRCVAEGLPKAISLHADEIRPLCIECAKEILDVIKETVEKTPAELVADIMDTGLILVGGGSLIEGIDKYLEAETGLTVFFSEAPMECAAVGAGKAMDVVFEKRDIRKSKK